MIYVEKLDVEGKTVLGLKVELPSSPPLLLIIANKGFIMCGYLSIEAAEKLNVAAAMVSGVKSFDDVLNAEIKAVTSKAENLDVRVGLKGMEALKKLI